MIEKQLNSKVLGQLLVMQSYLINLPDRKSIFSFVCKGLLDIPGVKQATYSEKKQYQDAPASCVSFPVVVGNSFLGEVQLVVSDYDEFEPYRDYLSNFVFMLGIVLGERKQRQLNEEHQLLLEQRIEERTRELRTEKENLAESQRRFLDLMVNVNLLSVMLDASGNIIFCNKYLLRLTQYTEGEVMGKNWFDLFLAEEVACKVKVVFSDLMCGAELALNYENEIRAKNGEVLIISWNNTILRDLDRHPIGTASIGVDITERKRSEYLIKEKTEEIEAQNEEYLQINEELHELNQELVVMKERAEESDRLKTAFLQNMSHEIRTPMNAIMGFSDLLMLNFDNKEKLKKFSGIIGQRCSDLLEIINDILDISKIESGQLPINLEEFNLWVMFNELSDFFAEYKKRIGKEHLAFGFQSEGIPSDVLVITDKVKLKQIFINLITNAFKFTDNGRVECGCRLSPEGKFVFYVSDTGIGIPPDKHEFVFERFARLNEAVVRNVGGTGLGLPIVKGLVKLLDGEILLESEVDKGSTFSFSFSQMKTKPVYQEPQLFGIIDLKSLVNKTVLIVEDDFFNSEYLKEVLSGIGLNLLHAENGRTAVSIVETQAVDLVLMDIRLPDMDGYLATALIRRNQPDLTIIAQTAYASHDSHVKALAVGCNDYLSKPIRKDLLLSMIVRYLSGR